MTSGIVYRVHSGAWQIAPGTDGGGSLDEALYQRLATRVRDRRTGLGLSQQQQAEVSGLTRSTVASIETGRQSVSVHHLYALAHALGVAPQNLLPPADEGMEMRQSGPPTRVDLFVRSVLASGVGSGRKRA